MGGKKRDGEGGKQEGIADTMEDRSCEREREGWEGEGYRRYWRSLVEKAHVIQA